MPPKEFFLIRPGDKMRLREEFTSSLKEMCVAAGTIITVGERAIFQNSTGEWFVDVIWPQGSTARDSGGYDWKRFERVIQAPNPIYIDQALF